MAQWGNSNALYPDSLGNFQHYGISFVNYILLSDELRALNMGLLFFGWNGGVPTIFVAYVPARVIPLDHKRYAAASIITIDYRSLRRFLPENAINWAQARKQFIQFPPPGLSETRRTVCAPATRPRVPQRFTHLISPGPTTLEFCAPPQRTMVTHHLDAFRIPPHALIS